MSDSGVTFSTSARRAEDAPRAVLHARDEPALAAHGPLAGYRIEGELGRGRHSIVYLAQRPQDRRRVALKVARKAHLESIGGDTDLRSQFAAMAALAHPHVIEVFDCGIAGGMAWLAMEYAEGGNFEAYRPRRAGAGALPFVREAAGALAWLHGNGWVHRDVKPANLFVRQDGSLALGDFGCACRRGEGGGSTPARVLGTPRYAAPEQSEGAPADPAADVYALGACLYEMLAGQPLFPGITLTEVLGQHLLAPIPRLKREQVAWQPLLDAMLAKDPQRRLSDGQAVLWQVERARHSLSLPHGRGASHASRNPS